MIEFSQLTVLIVAEILVALLVVSGLLVFFALMRKGRIRKAARHLAERVQNDKPQRSERLKRLLAEHYGYAGSELEQTLRNLLQSEMQLYQNIINGALKDDQLFVQQVDVDVENLVLAYQGLQARQAVPAAPAVSDEEASEMQRLQEENERLSDELRVTMDTMGRMLNEYSTMFAGGMGDLTEMEIPKSSPSEQTMLQDEEFGLGTEDIEIPPYQGDESINDGLSMLDDGSGLMDDEVSEIIDEVMGMADEMNQSEQAPAKDKSPSIDESLMDELEKVDIEIPDMETPAAASASDETEEFTPGSLEDEWAKLLEEDAAASKSEKKE